jgi:hypothetical protein
LEKLKTSNRGNQRLREAQDLQQRAPAPWRSARPATEDISTLEKIKTCNTGNQHLGKAQDLQQREPASWRSSRPATEGISTLEKLRTCIRGYHHPRKTQYMQQRRQHLCRSQNFLLTRALLNLLRKGLGGTKPQPSLVTNTDSTICGNSIISKLPEPPSIE